MKGKIPPSKIVHLIAWFFLMLSFLLPMLRPSTPLWGVIAILVISGILINVSRKLKAGE